jgi:DNA-binding XRE family transcriptional regulator
MINVNKLKGLISENDLSQRKLADMLGMSETTFYTKMKKGVFDSDEMEQMIKILKIENPVEIFFASQVT